MVNVADLRPYRKVYLNGHPVPPQCINGEISISMSLWDELPSCSLSVWIDIDPNFEAGAYGKPMKTPSGLVYSFFMQRIDIEGGYYGDGNNRKLFSGLIMQCNPQYTDDGRVSLGITANMYGFMPGFTSVKRNEFYPSLSRKVTPHKDDDNVEARDPLPGDDRSWAIRTSGKSISLKEILQGIITQYPYKETEIDKYVYDEQKCLQIKSGKAILKTGIKWVDDEDNTTIGPIQSGTHLVLKLKDPITGGYSIPVFDDKENELCQDCMTDWEFIQYLANRYDADTFVDPESHEFYFKSRSAKNSCVYDVYISDKEIKGIHFYFHRNPEYINNKKQHFITPLKYFNPMSPNCALPMSGISYSFDIGSMQGGLMNSFTDKDGNLHDKTVVVENDGSIKIEEWELDKAKLLSPEADRFFKNYSISNTGWNDAKQFWKKVDTVNVDNSDNRKNPPFYASKTNLSFKTFGNIYTQLGEKYYIYNLGYGASSDGRDKSLHKCCKLEYTLGDHFMMNVGFRAF